ncbi:MAG: hypothetical protein E4H02_07340 [Lentisphaerales bacterium]|jgi:hypothetical protein|nr:MAG: hypothetical protein E4H02_07340 [Lentisphaerales bacterium]
MTEREKQLTLKWIECWRKAGPELERLRRADIRQANTKNAVAAFAGMVKAALRILPARPDSGLVEQQRYFRQLRT